MPGKPEENQTQNTGGSSIGFSFSGPAIFNQSQLSAHDIINANVGFAQGGVGAKRFEEFFDAPLNAVEAAPEPQRTHAQAKVKELKEEAAKGKDASDSVLAKLLNGLVDLVPVGVSAVVAAFGQPILAGIAGPANQECVGEPAAQAGQILNLARPGRPIHTPPDTH